MEWLLLLVSGFGFGFFAGSVHLHVKNEKDEGFISSVGFLVLFFILWLHFFAVVFK